MARTTRTIDERIAKAQAEIERLEALAIKKGSEVEEAVAALSFARGAVDDLLDAVMSGCTVEKAKDLRAAVADLVTAARKADALAS